MSKLNAGNLFMQSLLGLLKLSGRLIMILFSWCLKIIGVLFSKTGETIEQIIIKKNR